MQKETEYTFTYGDLARATGSARNTISQHRARGHFDPESIESVAIYLARYGCDDLKRAMLDAIAWRQIPSDPGGWKKKRKKKRSS